MHKGTLWYIITIGAGAGHNDFDASNIHYKGKWKGVSPEYWDFGPLNGNKQSKCQLDPKSWDFHGPPLPVAQIMDLPK